MPPTSNQSRGDFTDRAHSHEKVYCQREGVGASDWHVSSRATVHPAKFPGVFSSSQHQIACSGNRERTAGSELLRRTFVMEEGLKRLAARAREVAEKAESARHGSPVSMDALHRAMIDYRRAAMAYMAHPSVGDSIRSDATRYTGETRAVVERIAELVDHLNELK